MTPLIPAFATAIVLSTSTLFAATSPKVRLQADTTEVHGSVTYVSGHVRITHLNTTMQADRAVYDPTMQKITLDGAVQVDQRKGKNRVTHSVAPHIVYSLDTQALDVTGPSRTLLKNS